MPRIKIDDLLLEIHKNADVKNLAKEWGRNHNLALKLWETRDPKARLMATQVEEPPKAKEDQLDSWMKDADFWDLADAMSDLISRTPLAFRKMQEYIDTRSDYIKRSGYLLLGAIAKNGVGLESSVFENYLELIQKRLSLEVPRVREAMAGAFIAIGSRNIELNEKALRIAAKLDLGQLSDELNFREKLSTQRLQTRLK
ncbi:MAG: hypothetical protein A2802_00155 [Candidatus Woykebacteria bacterium RIFCSPHIGHO2_01_FULL_43_29]|nr:MAG: hypothetical protein A2802_00155 [Candidatus Woykebacteria bacterium RIFCSPHIGHO2_01_FULL_43_29]